MFQIRGVSAPTIYQPFFNPIIPNPTISQPFPDLTITNHTIPQRFEQIENDGPTNCSTGAVTPPLLSVTLRPMLCGVKAKLSLLRKLVVEIVQFNCVFSFSCKIIPYAKTTQYDF